MTSVELKGVTKQFSGITAVDDLSMSILDGEFLTLLGPSGCGKTTTLRMIAGLEQLTHGKILLESRDVTAQPPHKRNIGMVFQNYALFPHKTVGENIKFPLEMKGVEKEEQEKKLIDVLDLVELPNTENNAISELSGGQQQRIALARALVFEPDVLLLDEPLSALDKVLRQQLRIELRDIQKEVGITTIYVTHDQTEAFSLSDRVAIMANGRLIQIDSPVEIYENPKTKFSAGFIGQSSKFTGKISELEGSLVLKVNNDLLFSIPESIDTAVGRTCTAFLKAEKLTLYNKAKGNENEYSATIKAIDYLGEKTRFLCEYKTGEEIVVTREGYTDLSKYSVGGTIYIYAPEDSLVIL